MKLRLKRRQNNWLEKTWNLLPYKALFLKRSILPQMELCLHYYVTPPVSALLSSHIFWVLALLLIILNIVITVTKAKKGLFLSLRILFKSFCPRFFLMTLSYFFDIYILLFCILRNVTKYFIPATFSIMLKSCKDLWSWNEFLLNHSRHFCDNEYV